MEKNLKNKKHPNNNRKPLQSLWPHTSVHIWLLRFLGALWVSELKLAYYEPTGKGYETFKIFYIKIKISTVVR